MIEFPSYCAFYVRRTSARRRGADCRAWDARQADGADFRTGLPKETAKEAQQRRDRGRRIEGEPRGDSDKPQKATLSRHCIATVILTIENHSNAIQLRTRRGNRPDGSSTQAAVLALLGFGHYTFPVNIHPVQGNWEGVNTGTFIGEFRQEATRQWENTSQAQGWRKVVVALDTGMKEGEEGFQSDPRASGSQTIQIGKILSAGKAEARCSNLRAVLRGYD